MYKKMYESNLDGKTIRISDYILKDNGDQIPRDSANTDYQEFLKWEAEGNIIGDPEPVSYTHLTLPTTIEV